MDRHLTESRQGRCRGRSVVFRPIHTAPYPGVVGTDIVFYHIPPHFGLKGRFEIGDERGGVFHPVESPIARRVFQARIVRVDADLLRSRRCPHLGVPVYSHLRRSLLLVRQCPVCR